MELPAHARELSARWKFQPTEELPGGHCSRVFANADRVLKIPFQGEEMTYGRVAAERLSGVLGPTIYETDPGSGAVLMERLSPGTNLANSNLDENDAIELTSGFIEKLQSVNPAGMLPLTHYYEHPSELWCELLRTTPSQVFLHGDLHHYNIIQGRGSDWVPIDPKGLVGDPSFEVIAFLRNPMESLGSGDFLVDLTTKRIQRFAQILGLNPWRIAAWLAVDIAGSEGPWAELDRVMPVVLTNFDKIT